MRISLECVNKEIRLIALLNRQKRIIYVIHFNGPALTPRKFWKLIRLNDYFCNISMRLGFDERAPIDPNFRLDVDEMYDHVDSEFDLISDPITSDELEICIDSIEITKSSCVPGISTSICKQVGYIATFIMRCSIIIRH